MVLERVSEVLKRLSRAAMRAGRDPSDVALLAVTKTVGIDLIREAIDAGLRTFGENRVQEAAPKIAHFGTGTVKWHLIGSLQKNKARKAVELFDVIESIDSFDLAERISRYAGEQGKVQRIYVQLKLGDEPSKHGIDPDAVEALIRKAAALPNVRIEGLMGIPPYYNDPEGARPHFRRLRELRDELSARGMSVKGLSMGMSHDFEIAIEEGATEVRVGSAIFGERSTV